MPDKKYKTPNGQIVSEKELQNKYGEKFNSLIQNKTFSEVNEPVYKTPNGKFEAESVLVQKYGDKFNELKTNNTFVLDAPIVKKKVPTEIGTSTSTSQNQKLVSGQVDGSLDLPNPNNQFNRVIPKAKTPKTSKAVVSENFETTESPMSLNVAKLKQYNPEITKLSSEYEQAKLVPENKISEIRNEVENKFSKKGVLNNLQTGAKKFVNAIAYPTQVALSGGNEPEPLFEVDEFADEKKAVEQKIKNEQALAKKQNKPIPTWNQDQIDYMVKERKIAKLVNSEKDSQVRSFLEAKDQAYTQDEFGRTERERMKIYNIQENSSLNEKDKLNLKKQDVVLPALTNATLKIKDYNEKIVKKEPLSAEEIEDYKSQFSNYDKLTKEAIELKKEYLNTQDKLGDSKENLDLFNREYSWGRHFKNLDATVRDIVSGGIGAVDYGIEATNYGLEKLGLPANPLSTAIQPEARRISKSIKADADKIRSEFAKPVSVENINNWNDFGNWIADTAVSQAPIFALIATGAPGVATIGGYSAGDKFESMLDEKDAKNYSEEQLLAIPAIFGASEVVSATVDLYLFKNASRVYNSASRQERQLIVDGMAKRFLDASGNVLKSSSIEAVDETFTQGVQNFADIYIGGDKNKKLTDGFKDVASAGFFMGAMLNVAPMVVAKATKKFSTDSSVEKVNKEILALEFQLDNKDLTDNSRNIIQEQLVKAKDKSKSLLEKRIGDMESLSNAQFNEINKLEKTQVNIQNKANEIKKDNSVNPELKKQILDNLKSEFSANEQRRVNLLQRGASVQIERLPEEDQIRLKEKASRELMKEQNPDGTASITLKDEEISKRAIQIYNNEIKQQNEQIQTTTTEQKPETQPQAEIQETEQEKLNVPVSEIDNSLVDNNQKEADLLLEKASNDFYERRKELESQGKTKQEADEITYNEFLQTKEGKRYLELTNETASPTNIESNADVRPRNEPMGEMGVEQKPTAEIVAEENIQSTNDARTTEGETEVDYALKQIDKGVLTWNGDIMSPRIDLGMSWADIRKGEADLKRGKVDSVPAKRLIESLSNAKKEGGYRYKLGTGGANMRSSEFVSFEDMQRLENEYQLTDSELEEINTNQEQLAKEYDDYINSLDEETQNEILENYEAEIDNRAEVGENPQSRKSEKNVSDEKTSRKQQRKKIAEATIDDFANALKDLLPKANTEGVKTQGLSQDDIIDFIAKNAKLLANTGIEIDEAIRQVIAKLKDNFEDFDVKIEDVKAKLEPNKEVVETQKERDDIFAEEIFNKPNLEKISGNFEEMAFNFPNTGEVGTYLSGKTIEKYTKESPENNQEIFKIKLVDSLKHGIDVVQLAFEKFGDDFVGKTLDFINSNALPLESKALLMISLENELNRQKTLRPEDKNLLQKQLNLVRIKRQAFARSNSLALNMNKLQKFAEIGFDVNEITDKMFSPSEKETRKKIENAIESNINEINIEEEIQDEDFEITPPLSKRNKADVKKDISDALLKMKADLNKVSRGGTLSVTIPYYKQLEAVTPHILKLAKLYSELGGMKTKEIIDEIYSQISESFPSLKRKDVVDVIKENQEKKQPKKDKKIKDLVKQALINKGYFREVNKKQSDGTTEVVKFLDWKKLAGEEGSIENIKNKTESALKEIGYTESQIESMQKALIEEYNDLRANIIEKSLNELESRNRIKPSVNRKTISKRLAELYNYGIFNEDMDKYSNLLNSAIGFNEFEQKQFEKLKEYGKALSVLFSFENKNNKGNKFSELAIKTQANIINHEIKNLLSVASFMEGNKMYKFTSVLRDYAGLSQRAKLLSLKQVLENPFSGFIERMFQKAGDAFYQKEDGKLVANRKKLAKMIYSDITLKGGLFYGEVTSSLTSQTKVEDWLNKRSENEIYHLLLTNMTGRSYLEGADSMNKALITEKIFHKNLVSLLTNKTNPIGQMSKQEAMNYVAESLTGQNFEDAKKLAEEAIDKVNNESGKNILPKTPQNIIRFANDIVKESLLQGNKLDIESIEKSYNSAYKSAGLTIGHEANNIISKGAGMLNARVEVALEKAIKEKKWNEATILTLESILTKNIINPFVGGGFNWLFLTLQKAGMDPISLISDFAKYRNNKIDMTTEEGIKNLENALVRATNLRYTASRTFIGAVISIAMATALISSGADDDLDEWLKENEWARKYSKVILPTVITLILSAKNEELGKGLQDLLNIKSDNFNETLSVLKSVDSENKSLPGEIGRVSGKYFDTPIPWRLVKDVDNIKRGLNGIPEYKSVYKVNGFLNGVYQGGFVDYVGLRPSDTEDEYKTEDEKRKESKFSYPKMPSLPRPPRP